jgi:hypothetical protein
MDNTGGEDDIGNGERLLAILAGMILGSMVFSNVNVTDLMHPRPGRAPGTEALLIPASADSLTLQPDTSQRHMQCSDRSIWRKPDTRLPHKNPFSFRSVASSDSIASREWDYDAACLEAPCC